MHWLWGCKHTAWAVLASTLHMTWQGLGRTGAACSTSLHQSLRYALGTQAWVPQAWVQCRGRRDIIVCMTSCLQKPLLPQAGLVVVTSGCKYGHPHSSGWWSKVSVSLVPLCVICRSMGNAWPIELTLPW